MRLVHRITPTAIAIPPRRCILQDEWMFQQLARSPPLRWIPLKTTSNEIPKLSARGRRRLRWLRHTDSTHKASPISLPSNRKRKLSQVKFKNADSEAPDISSITIILAVV